MPTSTDIDGQRIFRPGVYGRIDTSALAGSGTSTANVALIADLPLFEKAEPVVFASARALSDHDPASDLLRLIARYAFAPAADEDIPGGASTLTIVSTATTTRAFANLLDAGAGTALTLQSRVWGTAGNRLLYTIDKTSDTHTIVIGRDGISEEYAIVCPSLGSIQYTGAQLATAKLQWSAATVRYEWSRLLGPKVGGDPLVVNTFWIHCPTAGVVSVTLAAGAGAVHASNVTVAITGTTLAGAAQTETVTLEPGDNTGESVASWGSITSVTVNTADAAWVGTATLGCENGRVIATAGRKISGVVAELALLTGVVATVSDPRAGSIDAADADYTSGEVSVTAAFAVRADIKLLLMGLASSQLVDATRGASGLRVDLSSDLAGSLAGGTETSPDGTADWQTALDTILDRDIQIVVPLDSSAAIHALLARHCNNAALQGYERNAWAGAAASETKAQVATRAAALNTAFVSLVVDSISVDHPNGTTPTLDPPWLALLCACMQAGSPVAWPLTRNRPAIRAAYQTWAPNRDANELISKGLTILTTDRLGWRIERDVTTYLTDDNPFRSGRSAWESLQTSVRDLRNALNAGIGTPGTTGAPAVVRRKAADRLDAQVGAGVIKAWRNLIMEDLGDRYRLDYEAAPTEELVFIELNVSARRIAG